MLEEILKIVPDKVKNAMTSPKVEKPLGEKLKGYDFNEGVDYNKLFESYMGFGNQASNLAEAIKEINKMITWRLSDDPVAPDEEEDLKSPEARKKVRCSIYLAYISCVVSTGVRDIIRYLCEHKMVDLLVTTAGGVEEDIMKCLCDTYVNTHPPNVKQLHEEGINKNGSILTPHENYNKFKNWLLPIIDDMYQEEKSTGKFFSPSTIISRLGKEINDPQSIYYWCYKNSIPVYCPGFTDGVIGDALYLYSFKHNDFVLDIAVDLKYLDTSVLAAKKTGSIILGGGVIKHHICNANLMRNGMNHAVYINTGVEYDASDAGAAPDEAVSWGKIRGDNQPIKVFCDASIVFPIIVAQTFVKNKELASRLIP